MVLLIFFASSRDRSGVNEIEVNVKTISELRDYLTKTYNRLDSTYMSKCRFAVNNKYITSDTFELTDKMKVILAPPVSGG